MQEEPFFSIVIPTRDRFNTFRQAFESAITQDFHNFEIIVSDNSTVEDRDVEKWLKCRAYLQDKRVRYIRTCGSLEMHENWESATLKAEGQYILVLPDRWVMKPGVLAILYKLISCSLPECIFWGEAVMDADWKSISDPGNPARPVYYANISSRALLKNLLQFNGYRNDTVFMQPFPRGLNSAYRRDIALKIRSKYDTLFSPISCDYTSGVSMLLETTSIIQVSASFYRSVGRKSNGQNSSVYGCSKKVPVDAITWCGLEIDSVFLTIIYDIRGVLRRHGCMEWEAEFDKTNVLLSILSEIHFKEWHGSPLDTKQMKRRLFDFALMHMHSEFGLRRSAQEELGNYEAANRVRFVRLRKLLARLRLLEPLVHHKHLWHSRISNAAGLLRTRRSA